MLADINRLALEYAAVNAELNGVANVEVVHSDILRGVEGPIDLVISNPPYLIDDAARVYRDGRPVDPNATGPGRWEDDGRGGVFLAPPDKARDEREANSASPG